MSYTSQGLLVSLAPVPQKIRPLNAPEGKALRATEQTVSRTPKVCSGWKIEK